jgi:glycine hydroxymethyltransferase
MENDMNLVVNWIDTCLMHADDEAALQSVKVEINEFMQQFPLYADWEI